MYNNSFLLRFWWQFLTVIVAIDLPFESYIYIVLFTVSFYSVRKVPSPSFFSCVY